ncbi:hypothetical protein [Pedobacter gandavensis]
MFYKWKSKYSGMEVSQVKQLKEMEKELYFTTERNVRMTMRS